MVFVAKSFLSGTVLPDDVAILPKSCELQLRDSITLTLCSFSLLFSNTLTLSLTSMTLGGGMSNFAVDDILEGTLQGSFDGGFLPRIAVMCRGTTLVGKFAL